jgi:hypothetical protein
MNPVTNLPLPPTCPPPIPPPPLTPPAFALTGTDDLILLPFLSEPSVEVEQVPALQVVPQPRSRAARAPFVTLVLTLLGGGLVTLLLVNTALSQGAFAVQKLQKTNVGLTEQRQELSKSLADSNQPAALASKAVALGMVPGGAPAFLRLPDGKVMGVPKVAVPLPKPTPSVTVTPAVPGATSPPVAGAPVTGTAAPGTSAAGAPVTSAGVTSAPVTSAAVTSAAVTSAAGTSTSAGAVPTITPSKGKP